MQEKNAAVAQRITKEAQSITTIFVELCVFLRVLRAMDFLTKRH